MTASRLPATLSWKIRASLSERARWFARQRQARTLTAELGLPGEIERDLETLQAIASIKAHLHGPVRTIIDVGAHVGAFAEPAMRVLRADEVVCIEPYRPLHPLLRSRLVGLNHRILDCALADTTHMGCLRVHPDRSMSSLLDADPELLADHFGSCNDAVEATPVRVNTLDSEIDGLGLAEPFFLKLDTQGAELSILRGARKTLQLTSAVLVEHMFTTPYQGGSSFAELISLMDELGFFCTAAIDIRRRPTNRVSAVDFLFLAHDSSA